MIDHALQELADTAASQLTGPDQVVWLQRLAAAYPRFTAALQECLDTGADESGLALCTALGRFWWMGGHAVEGRRWLEAFLARGAGNEALRASALAAAGGVAYAQADYPAAKDYHHRALAAWTHLSDQRGQAEAHNQLGMVARAQATYDEARSHHEAGLSLYRTLSDPWGIAACLSNLGVVALFIGDLEQAQLFHEQALALRRQVGDQRGIASSLGNIGNCARLRGDSERAWQLHTEALGIRGQLNDPWGVAGSLLNLALAALAQKKIDKARWLLNEAQPMFRFVGDALGLCECLDAEAILARDQGNKIDAVRLFAAAHKARSDIHAPLPAVAAREVAQILTDLRRDLGTEMFDGAWQQGMTEAIGALPAVRNCSGGAASPP